MRPILLTISCFLLYLAAHAQPQQSMAGNGSPNVYALIVGISSYLEKEIPQLQYANRDAAVFADYLRSKAGGAVPEENITLLTDSNATTSAVYNAIYQIKKEVKKGDLVFFYFSGHGDLENATMYNNGFLICYDSPPINYVRLSLSIDYLNDIANTLSAQTNANVVLITDACHSGKLAGSRFKGNSLVGEQLRAVKKKEIRITSCADNQLSNENEAWGGGRGVFSYYLINGLKGMADQGNDGIVTLNEVISYLNSSFEKDAVLKRENIVQTPVLKGDTNFILARVDTATEKETRNEMMNAILMANATLPPASANTETIPANAQQYFFSLLRKDSLEEITERDSLDDVAAGQIPFLIISRLAEKINSAAGKIKLMELDSSLRMNNALLKKFNAKLAVEFDEKGQAIINKYLLGDEAELERRRYYNSNNNGYDVYPKMFSVALKLTEPDSYLHNNLQVKLHYFSGVAIRLKIPVVEEATPLIEQALAEQKKALELEEHAAYIYNELGVLYAMKKDYPLAEKYYKKAGELSPGWVVPLANLSGLYASTRSFEKGIEASDMAKALNPGLLCIYVNSGYLYEKKGDLLMAEELYQKSIQINSRHYSPFERLGYVYLNTTRYALADSFLYEADIRKQGFHFTPGEFQPDKQDLTPILIGYTRCEIDSNQVGPKDILGYCALALNATESFGVVNADGVLPIDRRYGQISPQDMETGERAFKKAIALDKSNPLAFHYLGKLMYWQKRWAEADILFNLALQYHPDSNAFRRYVDSMSHLMPPGPAKECIIRTFSNFYYNGIEDHYFLAALYEQWHHYTEAEMHYRKIIAIDSVFIGGYARLWTLLESIGRYKDAEDVVRSFMARNPDKKAGEAELNAFYKRVLKIYPDDADWNYRAGLFLYQLAAAHPDDYPDDKKTVTPDTHEEILNLLTPDLRQNAVYSPFPGPSRDDGIYKGAAFVYFPRNEGIACLLKADSLSAFPDEALADINDKLGDLYTWQGLPERAIPRYTKSIGLLPANSGVRIKLIGVYDTVSRFRDALLQLDSLNGRKEMNFAMLMLKAKYQVHSGNFGLAQQLLDSVQKIHPYTMPAILDLNGRLQLMWGHEKEALEFYKKLMAANGADSADAGNTLEYTLARIFAKQGKNEEAWKWLEAAAKHGFRYAYVLTYDNYLDGLRKTPKWNTFMKRITRGNPKQPIMNRRISEGY